MGDTESSVPEVDEGDAKAAGIGAATSAAVLGGPPGAVAGAALGAVRGVAIRKGAQKAADHLEQGSDPLGLDEPTPAESGGG